MEILLLAGAAALIGAYAASRSSRDRELARLEKKARRDARIASRKGDAQACAYYTQVARDLAVQRLQEAEQRAVNEAHRLQGAGSARKAERMRAQAEEMRRRLATEYHVHAPSPLHSLPVAQPPAADVGSSGPPPIQPYVPYAPGMALPTQSLSSPIVYLQPSHASSSSSHSVGPPGSMVHHQQPPSAAAYPSIPPPAYVPPVSRPNVIAVPTISSAPTRCTLSEPYVEPIKPAH